jgi:hypothetical protein
VLRDQLRAGELVKNSYKLDGGRPLLERFLRQGRQCCQILPSSGTTA